MSDEPVQDTSSSDASSSEESSAESSEESSSEESSASSDESSEESSSEESSADSSEESSSEESSSEASSSEDSSEASSSDESSEESSSEESSSEASSSSDDSSSDNSSSSDDSSSEASSEEASTADGGGLAVARTNADLDHSNALTLAMVRIRLFDPASDPMPNAPYRLTVGSQKWEDKADGDGWVEQHVQKAPAQCLVEWGDGGQPGTYLYTMTTYLDFAEEDAQTALKQRLHNLGYSDGNAAADNEAAFRRDYGFGATDDIASTLQNWHDDPGSVKPKQKPPDSSGSSSSPAPTASQGN